jgi:hypothetical protein
MISEYGPSTWDDLLVARRCRRCGWVTARQMILPGQVRPDSPAHWMDRVQDMAARTVLNRRCPCCRATPAAGPGFETVLMSSLVFLEAEGDLQLTARIERRAAPSASLALVRMDGTARPLPWPLDPGTFEEKVGAPLSVRAAWRDLLARNPAPARPAVRRIQDGYHLVLAPRIAREQDREAAKAATVKALDDLSGKSGSLFIESLRDLEELRRPFRKETYHDWLPDFAGAIADGEIQAFAAVHPPSFAKAFAREAASLGVQATAATTQAQGMEVLLARGPLRRRVHCAHALLRTIHLGLSFQQGVVPLLEEVARLTAMERLARRIEGLVRGRYETRVRDGTLVEFLAPGARPATAPEVDLATLVTKLDSRGVSDDRLAALIGLDPRSRRFIDRRPRPGECACGRPATLGIKIRPPSLFGDRADRLLARKDQGLLLAVVLECPDHVRYLRSGEDFSDLAAASRALEAAASSVAFPLNELDWLEAGGKNLVYAVGPDISTVATDAGFAAGLVGLVTSRPLRGAPAALPGPRHRVAVYAPFQHVVVLSPDPVASLDREELRLAVLDALSGPLGRTDPGVALGFYREMILDRPARGRFERPREPPAPDR